jgi:hypothetical protein
MGNSWAVDLANIGAIYPWQGSEVIMFLVAFVLWIVFHVLQIKQENVDYNEDIDRYGSAESIKKALDEHPT